MNHGDYNDMMRSIREARAEVDRLTEALSAAEKERDDAVMAAAVGEAVIAAMHNEPVSDFMQSFGPVMEAQMMGHTIALLRADNEALWRVVKDACAYLRVTDDDENDWPKLPAYADAIVRERDELRAQLADIAAMAVGLSLLEEEIDSLRKERDTLQGAVDLHVQNHLAQQVEIARLTSALARLQTPTSDLPPIGTRWGDIPDEVRARLPVGTVLGSAGARGGLPLRLGSELGYYLEDHGLEPILRSAIHPGRRILSYPERS